MYLFNTPPEATDVLIGSSAAIEGTIVDIGYLPGALSEPPEIVGLRQLSDLL